MVIPSKSFDSSVLSAALHEKAERKNTTKNVHKDRFLVFIITIWLFRLTKLRKATQKALGDMEEMMAEGENGKLGFTF